MNRTNRDHDLQPANLKMEPPRKRVRATMSMRRGGLFEKLARISTQGFCDAAIASRRGRSSVSLHDIEHFRPSHGGPIDQITVHLETACNVGDAKALAYLYSDDAMLMPPNQSMVSERLEIQTWFERVFQRLRSVRIVPIKSKIIGDQAYQVGTFTAGRNQSRVRHR